MKIRRGIFAAVLSMGATAGILTASPAQADPIGSCPYPYVCLLDPSSAQRLGQFQDVTSTFQPIAAREYTVQNTRNDDVVYFRKASDHNVRFCMLPNGVTTLPYAVDGIMISTSPTCQA